MKRKNMARNALFTSIMSLLLCVSMLVGTTFAWFTDEVTSANNIIKSGNLDVVLEYWDGDSWEDVAGKSDILAGDLWEPGYVDVAYLRMKNAGSLALKYQLGVNIVNEKPGVNKAGAEFNLSDSIYFDVIEGVNGQTNPFAGRSAAMDKATQNTKISVPYSKSATLEAGTDYIYLALVVHMPTTVGNDANHDGETIPQIDLGINVFATQFTKESDSFDNQYDAPAVAPDDAAVVTNEQELREALNGDKPIWVAESFGLSETVYIPASAARSVNEGIVIAGNGSTISRAAGFTGTMFDVASDATLNLANVTVDGGAVWTGEINPHLQRGTVNSGVTATGAIINTNNNSKVILSNGAVLQNNDGANAVSLGLRTGNTLTLNGGQIINNHSAAGAIYGGGAITMNSGKINGNHGGIGGAIRVVTNVGTVLTMNGGEMNHNMSDDVGGAIWAGSSRSNNVYVLNGGEMAYNYSPKAGGAMYAGYYETVKIGGTFSMHDNVAPEADGIRFHNHASLVMTGGNINNGDNALFLLNNSASITGGTISGNFAYGGGLGLTIGKADIDGVIAYNLNTNHNTAYLASEFNSFKFTVNENESNFAQFNFKPAAGYTYTEGDEAKLVCMNEGYQTYWDAATGTFRLQAAN